jgi:alkylation response protein AidB-like acyl-CoA dehydrogenase
MNTIYFSPEHELFRDQIRRFAAEDIRPNAEAWEAAGEIPREVFRRMGALGFFGARYAEEYGGAGMDVFASVVLGEELGRAGLSGLAASVLVHTDMASHRHRHRRDRAGRGIGRGRADNAGRAQRQRLGAERGQAIHHQRGAGRPVFRRRAH